MHDGSADPHGEIAHVLFVLGVAEPGVDDAVTPDQGDAAVEHHELAMIALVQHADVASSARMVQLEFAAGGGQLALDVGPMFLPPSASTSTRTVTPARPRSTKASRSRRSSAPVLPEEGLEVHGPRGVLDLVDQTSKNAPFSNSSTLLPS